MNQAHYCTMIPIQALL